MNTIKFWSLRFSVVFAVIGTLVFYATEAASSAPQAAMQEAETPAAVSGNFDQQPIASEVAALDVAFANPAEALPSDPLPSQSLPYAPMVNDERYPYVEGSQLNRPVAVTVATALAGWIPMIPETSAYSMLIAGLLGLTGLLKWKGRSV
jgi:hypothetical protein